MAHHELQRRPRSSQKKSKKDQYKAGLALLVERMTVVLCSWVHSSGGCMKVHSSLQRTRPVRKHLVLVGHRNAGEISGSGIRFKFCSTPCNFKNVVAYLVV